MDVNIKSREGVYIAADKSGSKSLDFLYGRFAGRLILLLLTRRFVSNIVSVYMNSRYSKHRIRKTIEQSNIDLSEFESTDYKSYNDFFTRKIKSGKRTVDMDAFSFVSPCDAKVSAYKISENSSFYIKNSYYTVSDLWMTRVL